MDSVFTPFVISEICLYGLSVTLIMVITLFINTKPRIWDILLCLLFGAVNTGAIIMLKGNFELAVAAVTVLLWAGMRMLSTKRHVMEIILSGSITFSALMHFYIFGALVASLTDDLFIMICLALYACLLCALFIIFYRCNITIFKSNWIKDFFEPDDKAVKRNRYSVFALFIIINLLTMIAIYSGAGRNDVVQNAVLTLISAVLIVLFFLLIKVLVEYCILHDINARNLRYQQNLEQFMKVIRSQRHDFNVHLHAISGLVESGNFDQCKEYVATMVRESNAINDVLPVHSPIISAMLHGFREEAESAGINMDIEILYDMKELAVTPYDLNRILGNLIQNAIDEIRRNKDNQYGIRLKISKADNMTVIDISNRFDPLVQNVNHMFNDKYTTKRRHDGIGLNTILRITESYGGMIYPEIHDDIIHFILRLPNERQ